MATLLRCGVSDTELALAQISDLPSRFCSAIEFVFDVEDELEGQVILTARVLLMQSGRCILS